MTKHIDKAPVTDVNESVHAFWEGLRSIHQQTADFVSRRATEDTAFLSRLLACKDAGEVLAAQQKWLGKTQEDYAEQGRKLMALTTSPHVPHPKAH